MIKMISLSVSITKIFSAFLILCFFTNSQICHASSTIEQAGEPSKIKRRILSNIRPILNVITNPVKWFTCDCIKIDQHKEETQALFSDSSAMPDAPKGLEVTCKKRRVRFSKFVEVSFIPDQHLVKQHLKKHKSTSDFHDLQQKSVSFDTEKDFKEEFQINTIINNFFNRDNSTVIKNTKKQQENKMTLFEEIFFDFISYFDCISCCFGKNSPH